MNQKRHLEQLLERSIRSVFLTKQPADVMANLGSGPLPGIDVSPSDQSLGVVEQMTGDTQQ